MFTLTQTAISELIYSIIYFIRLDLTFRKGFCKILSTPSYKINIPSVASKLSHKLTLKAQYGFWNNITISEKPIEFMGSASF